jgi:putative ABC transport system permease protein
MRRVVLGELLHRRSRTLALLAGILVATAAFTVLTGTSTTQRLEARGTVAKSFRGHYDVLVRPRGSRTPYERRTGQVQPNFLSGLFGGISTEQWRAIQGLPGVEVAAPIANIGYLLPTARVPVVLSEAAAGTHGRTLLRARIAWRSDRGLTRVRDAPDYVYVTPNRLRREPFEGRGGFYRSASLREYVPGRRRPLAVCFSGAEPAFRVIYGPWTRRNRMQVGCYSRRTGAGRAGDYAPLRQAPPQVELRWSFPLLLTAIDPESEARLTGLDRGLVTGRYLRGGDGARVLPPQGEFGYQPRVLPVLAASRTYVDEQAELAVERLGHADVARWIRPFVAFETHTLGPMTYLMQRPRGSVVERLSVPASAAYRQLLRELRPQAAGDFAHYSAQSVDSVWRVAATGYARQQPALEPATRPIDHKVWQLGLRGGPLQWAYAPPSTRDTRFRAVERLRGEPVGDLGPQHQPPLLTAVGTFDPDRLGAAYEPGAAPLATLQPPLLNARDGATTARLGGRPLLPNGNLGGYLAQPPALLTTLRAARAFGGRLFPELRPARGISAIRVRVAGVTGIDAPSRERIRQAAERIAAATGLDVDITAGASGAPTALDLPAGLYGRPRLALSETWVRKGVAARVLTAVDRKSVLLFGLILVVCALFVTNAASAAVRARRIELGVLSCLGWSAWRLFAVVLAEVSLVGLAAGVLGGLLALPLAALVGVGASPARAALAVPSATGLAMLAGLVPAARAARADPIAAVRPMVLEAGRAWRPRGIGGLALVNLVRTPGRTALGAIGLAIGVCALTLLLAATIAFNDVLVGTLLGDAVAVRVRTTDYIAVIATIALGVAAVADVLFLNLRERAAELATLLASGWDDGALGRLVVLEGLWIGALGAVAGGALGLAGAAVFAGELPTGLLLTTLAAAVCGTLVAGAGAIVPAVWLRRAQSVPLLAGE